MILYKRENKQDDPLEILLEEEKKQQARTILAKLDSRELRVLELRYNPERNFPLTYQRIGALFNVSSEMARQIEKNAIKNLEGLIERQRREECDCTRKHLSANIANIRGCRAKTRSDSVLTAKVRGLMLQKKPSLVAKQQCKEEMKKQIKSCQICGRTNEELRKFSRINIDMDRLVIDHDHKTGHIRGVICHWCNQLLGNARDDIMLLNKVILYLSQDFSKNQLY